ncbi:MAG: TetR/AcrR family transcriptional regulator [Planctomycetota bacterium]|jgi:AcrR family transcriptional regulator
MAKPIANTQAADIKLTIVAVATGLFARKGFEATSVREIAESVGVTKPTIYYYFGSKLGLLEYVLDASFSPLVKRLDAINAREDGADAVKCLEDGVWAVFESAVERNDILRFVHNCAFGPADQPASRIIMEDVEEVVDQFRRLIHRAVGGGLVEDRRAEQATIAFRGVIDTYIVDYFMGKLDGLSRAQAADVAKGLLEGYGARSRESGRRSE